MCLTETEKILQFVKIIQKKNVQKKMIIIYDKSLINEKTFTKFFEENKLTYFNLKDTVNLKSNGIYIIERELESKYSQNSR